MLYHIFWCVFISVQSVYDHFHLHARYSFKIRAICTNIEITQLTRFQESLGSSLTHKNSSKSFSFTNNVFQVQLLHLLLSIYDHQLNAKYMCARVCVCVCVPYAQDRKSLAKNATKLEWKLLFLSSFGSFFLFFFVFK